MRIALMPSMAWTIIAIAISSPLAAHPRTDPEPAPHHCSLSAREVVERFIPLFYEQRDARTAFTRWVHPDYIQHNPNAASGRDAAIAFLQPFFDANPQLRYTVHRVIASDGLVAVQNEARFSSDAPPNAVVDIFRVEKCQIVEHWDVVQPVPNEAKNDNGMF
ncbi:polyketide cyclase [Altericroceibacterium spongiae]|uniref:Polyketide cyclase n=1 Tax=Altericroceibacterium spongiae TaxID=2320269 RepID=A0A420EIW8_9SPHN|nr:nuclear transport factor 2 family protein [Altericroceibacterium spongiae]RKF20672.1 polyketide cyclase [Altericroceibacterium spongiae]